MGPQVSEGGVGSLRCMRVGHIKVRCEDFFFFSSPRWDNHVNRWARLGPVSETRQQNRADKYGDWERWGEWLCAWRRERERERETGPAVVKSLNVLGWRWRVTLSKLHACVCVCVCVCLCVCAANKPSWVSPLPYRPATHPRIICVFCAQAYVFKHSYAHVCMCVCVCILTNVWPPLSYTHFTSPHKRGVWDEAWAAF